MRRPRKPLKQADRQPLATRGNRFGAHGKEDVCHRLPPVADDPLRKKEEVDFESSSEPLVGSYAFKSMEPLWRTGVATGAKLPHRLLVVARAVGMEPFMKLSRSGGLDQVLRSSN
jgi:hypothetical protein